jgi:hypothetical protein
LHNVASSFALFTKYLSGNIEGEMGLHVAHMGHMINSCNILVEELR